MKTKRPIYIRLSIMLLIFMSVAIPSVAACEDPEHDDDCLCDGHSTKIVSLLDLGDFTIDETITSSTPYWTFIVGGKKDKSQLLEFIKDRRVSAKQKKEWKKTLKEIWKKYPTDFKNGVIVITPDRKHGSPEIQLTENQQRILAEIGQEMGRAMEESLNEQITVQWAAEHPDFIYMASIQEGFSDYYASIAQSEALKPDNDFILQHMYYHYYNPRALKGIGSGGAPDACESSANRAKDYYRDGQNADSFRLLGYGSHFLTDVGNPMHTGAESEQIEDYFTRNMHRAYEDYVDMKWSKLKPFIGIGPAITAQSPSELTKELAKYSNGYLDRLIMRIDLNFRFNNRFDLSKDTVIESMTLNTLEMSYRYSRGLVRYVTTVPPTPGIKPLCPAGTPFDSSKYPQNWPRSDPMTFQCSWDGTGRVYTSGDKSALTGIYADDGYTITIQPSGAYFETPDPGAYQHPPVEITSGMRPGLNTLTLVVQNWKGNSMSYGSRTGIGTDQVPYIIQVNSPGVSISTPQIFLMEAPFILNESVETATGTTPTG